MSGSILLLSDNLNSNKNETESEVEKATYTLR